MGKFKEKIEITKSIQKIYSKNCVSNIKKTLKYFFINT